MYGDGRTIVDFGLLRCRWLVVGSGRQNVELYCDVRYMLQVPRNVSIGELRAWYWRQCRGGGKR